MLWLAEEIPLRYTPSNFRTRQGCLSKCHTGTQDSCLSPSSLILTSMTPGIQKYVIYRLQCSLCPCPKILKYDSSCKFKSHLAMDNFYYNNRLVSWRKTRELVNLHQCTISLFWTRAQPSLLGGIVNQGQHKFFCVNDLLLFQSSLQNSCKIGFLYQPFSFYLYFK